MPQTLAQMVRAKHPGAYDDLSDTQLEEKVLAKYPQYKDLPRTEQPYQPQDVRAMGRASLAQQQREQEGPVSRTMGRIAQGYQEAIDTPGVQTAAIAAGGLSALGPESAADVAANLRGAAGAVGRGAVRAGGAVADTLSPDVVGVVSPRGAHVLRVVQRLRDAAAKTPDKSSSPAAPPRLVGKAPTLTDSLTNILQELRTEATTPEATAPAVPGAAAGGSAAADLTARSLADRPRVVVRQPAPALSTTRSRELLEKFGGRQENPTPRPARVVEPDVDLTAQIERPAVQPASTAATPERAAERFGKIYRSEGGPVPLNRAMAAVRSASSEAKIKLTAEETRAGMDLVKQGYPAEGVMDAIAAQRALRASSSFANLPSASDVAAAVSERNASGRWGGGPAVKIAGNPFR